MNGCENACSGVSLCSAFHSIHFYNLKMINNEKWKKDFCNLHLWNRRNLDLSNSLGYRGSFLKAFESYLVSWVLWLGYSPRQRRPFVEWILRALIWVVCPWPPSWEPCDLFHLLLGKEGNPHKARRECIQNSTYQLMECKEYPIQFQVLCRI